MGRYKGREKCRILKEIRRKIADGNDIPYAAEECPHKGDCSGTCPKCEADLRYLEKQLEARAAAGKRIVVAAICAGLVAGVTGCSAAGGGNPGGELSGDVEMIDSGASAGDTVPSGNGQERDEFPLMGDIAVQE